MEDIINLDIVDIDDKGIGFGYYKGKKVNVRYGLPGDTVKVRIIRKGGKGWYKGFWGKLIDVVSPGPGRINPKCIHFGLCGGCRFQNWRYSYQLKYKKSRVLKAFSRYDLDVKIGEPISSSRLYYYRNRMDYPVGIKDTYPIIGLKAAGRWDLVVDLNECLLMSKESIEVIKAIERFMVKRGIVPYNVFSHKGFMKYIVVREGKFTGERLVSLVTNLGPFPYLDELIPILSSYSTGIIWSINPKIADVSIGEEIHPLYGNDYLNEKIGGFVFYIHPNAFFQTNSYQTQNLIDKVYKLADGGDLLLDLYSGVGLFTFSLAEKYEHVIGVENDEYSIYSADVNGKRSGYKNIKFIKGAVEDVISDFKFSPTTIVIDPPRPGMSLEAKKHVLRLKPKEIIYVSCNPNSMARDINMLSDSFSVYDVIQPIDMFPQTPHIESIAKLVLKN